MAMLIVIVVHGQRQLLKGSVGAFGRFPNAINGVHQEADRNHRCRQPNSQQDQNASPLPATRSLVFHRGTFGRHFVPGHL
jgi:hypothetical protein